jgi:hypothetical protein
VLSIWPYYRIFLKIGGKSPIFIFSGNINIYTSPRAA